MKIVVSQNSHHIEMDYDDIMYIVNVLCEVSWIPEFDAINLNVY